MLDVKILIDAKEYFKEITKNIEPTDLYDSDGYITWNSVSNVFFNENTYHEFEIHHGITKCVIVPDYKTYVFKFNKSGFDYDYCDAEAEVNKNAKIEGYDQYLADMVFLLKFGDIDIYVQERTFKFEDGYTPYYENSDRSDEHYNLLESISSDYCSSECIPLDWAADFSAYYSDAEFADLCQFLDNYNVNDLHEANIGYIGNRPVIFDYSGWFG